MSHYLECPNCRKEFINFSTGKCENCNYVLAYSPYMCYKDIIEEEKSMQKVENKSLKEMKREVIEHLKVVPENDDETILLYNKYMDFLKCVEDMVENKLEFKTEKNSLSIIIKGKCRSGKTTMQRLIYDCLRSLGYNNLYYMNDKIYESANLLKNNVKELAEKNPEMFINYNSHINIKTEEEE